jgi:TRAP transporter TAXI family solute receptor
MKIAMGRIWTKQTLFIFGPAVLLFVAITFLVYRVVDPAPPKHFIISTGEAGGNYHHYGKAYEALIKEEGIHLEVETSKGAWDNLARLGAANSKVDVAFVQDGLGSREKNPGLTSLGSVFYEPIWIFYRGKSEVTRFSQLKGQTIALGEKGGETHTMAKKLLKASGLDEKNSNYLDMTTMEEVTALKEGRVDAAFFIAETENATIKELIADPNLKLMSVDQAEAISRQIPYLHHLILPHGTYDLERNLPSKDIDLVSPTATLVVRDTIHPALVYLLLKAATKVHRGPGIFEKRHEFPTDKDFVFKLNSGAKNYYQSGAPFWLRYLPFWLATLIERFIFLIIPMAALFIPIARAIPKVMQWRIRNRIYQRYGELKFIETNIRADASPEKYTHYLEQLDRIEERVNHMKIPLDFSEYVYSLRGHIQFVRDRLERYLAKPKPLPELIVKV